MGLELGGILLQHASLVWRLKRSNDGSVAPRIFSNGDSGTIGGMQRSTNGFCGLVAISPAVVSFFCFYDVSNEFPPVPLVTCSMSLHEMASDFSLTDEEVCIIGRNYRMSCFISDCMFPSRQYDLATQLSCNCCAELLAGSSRSGILEAWN